MDAEAAFFFQLRNCIISSKSFLQNPFLTCASVKESYFNTRWHSFSSINHPNVALFSFTERERETSKEIQAEPVSQEGGIAEQLDIGRETVNENKE